jgi:hypothetical protein
LNQPGSARDAERSARAALARGDALMAYDVAAAAHREHPDDLALAHLAALALARAGAANDAEAAVARLPESGSPPAVAEEIAALRARLAKDRALQSDDAERATSLRAAADRYEVVAHRYESAYAAGNAATLSLLAGDRAHAEQCARYAIALIERAEPNAERRDYWQYASEAEAALVLGSRLRAHEALESAALVAGSDYAAMATTRRQLRLVCDALDESDDILDALAVPSVVHYCGHRVDTADDTSRFPVASESEITDKVRTYLRTRRVGFGYGSLASGSDIVIAEALVESGAEVHVVLPFARDEFEQVSVSPGGAGWSERFRRCLEVATSVEYSCDSAYLGDDTLFAHAARVAMGHSLNRAAMLDASVEQLAIWDGRETAGRAGTGYDVGVWRGAGHRTHVVDAAVGRESRPDVPSTDAENARTVNAVLFADFRGFSRLRDEQFEPFVAHVLGALARVLEAHGDAVLWRNSWGDAIAAVTRDVVSAASCVSGFHDALVDIDVATLGLPDDLELRIGAHVGPMLALRDPITGRPTYWGRELTRAARIEPRTPAGEVYVTDAFAALLALESDAPFVTEYVGRVTTAKDFETIPMYRLARRAGRRRVSRP